MENKIVVIENFLTGELFRNEQGDLLTFKDMSTAQAVCNPDQVPRLFARWKEDPIPKKSDLEVALEELVEETVQRRLDSWDIDIQNLVEDNVELEMDKRVDELSDKLLDNAEEDLEWTIRTKIRDIIPNLRIELN